VLAFLLIGTASLGQPRSDKPFKVCPEVVTAKDTPCKVLGATAGIIHRMEVSDTSKEDRERVKATIEMLRQLADALEKDLESSKPLR
jgi:hypothetical protein